MSKPGRAIVFSVMRSRVRAKTRLAGIVAISMILTAMQAETPGASGIEGSVATSPAHGGPTRMGEDDTAPVPNTTFEVLRDTSPITTFVTDAAGRFHVALPPGRYKVGMQEKKKIGRCGPFEVEVTAGSFKKVHWMCDSGMR